MTTSRCRSKHGAVRILAVLGGALSMGGCVKNAATGKDIFTLGMSKQSQIALGAEATPQFTQQFGGAVSNPDLRAYVTEVGKQLAAVTEADNPSLPWEFTFLNSDVVNAFALPGGKVFFTRGLAVKLSSEAEMAGVIGHEIGHVTAEHGAQKIAHATAWQSGIAVVAAVVDSSGNQTAKQIGALGVPALSFGSELVQLKFGRNEELEADRLGMRYMSRVGYDPAAQGNVMRVLQSLGKSGTPEILSTHPFPEDRIAQVNALLASDYAATRNNPQYVLKANEYRQRMLSKLALLPDAPDAGMVRAYYAGLGTSRPLWCAHCREDSIREGALESIIMHPVLVGMAR